MPKVATLKNQDVLGIYFYTGSVRKTAKATGLSRPGVDKIIARATDEERAAALMTAKQVIQLRIGEVVDLAYNRLVKVLRNPRSKISAKDLNIIHGTHLDKAMALNEWIKGKGKADDEGDKAVLPGVTVINNIGIDLGKKSNEQLQNALNELMAGQSRFN